LESMVVLTSMPRFASLPAAILRPSEPFHKPSEPVVRLAAWLHGWPVAGRFALPLASALRRREKRTRRDLMQSFRPIGGKPVETANGKARI
jgi:hypothetical protein